MSPEFTGSVGLRLTVGVLVAIVSLAAGYAGAAERGTGRAVAAIVVVAMALLLLLLVMEALAEWVVVELAGLS